LLGYAAEDGITVKLTTTSAEPENTQNKFRIIQRKYEPHQVMLKYSVQSPNNELPHYRRMKICSRERKITIWLDRGLDIFRFEDLRKPTFRTIESYLVIEESLVER